MDNLKDIFASHGGGTVEVLATSSDTNHPELREIYLSFRLNCAPEQANALYADVINLMNEKGLSNGPALVMFDGRVGINEVGPMVPNADAAKAVKGIAEKLGLPELELGKPPVFVDTTLKDPKLECVPVSEVVPVTPTTFAGLPPRGSRNRNTPT